MTVNEHLLAALRRVLAERPSISSPEARSMFAIGFEAGWQERSIDDHYRGTVAIPRERLAHLETIEAIHYGERLR